MHREVMEVLLAAGHEVFVVGGAVRDLMLGLEPKDFDLATSALVAEVVQAVGGVSVISRSGAPVVNVSGVEVATFRTDVGGRHSATFGRATMEQDAQRRDFTVNALFMSVEGEVLDPTGFGERDLQNRVLRFVGNAQERVLEDPTRVLRAFRLAAQKGLVMEAGTEEVLGSQATLEALQGLAQEQVGRELLKLLSVKNGRVVANAFRKMAATGVLGVVLPEVAELVGVEQNSHHLEGDAFEHTMLVLAQTEADPVLRFAALLHDIGKKPTQEVKK